MLMAAEGNIKSEGLITTKNNELAQQNICTGMFNHIKYEI